MNSRSCLKPSNCVLGDKVSVQRAENVVKESEVEALGRLQGSG